MEVTKWHSLRYFQRIQSSERPLQSRALSALISICVCMHALCICNRFAESLFQSKSFFNFRCVFAIWTVKRWSSIRFTCSLLTTNSPQSESFDSHSTHFLFVFLPLWQSSNFFASSLALSLSLSFYSWYAIVFRLKNIPLVAMDTVYVCVAFCGIFSFRQSIASRDKFTNKCENTFASEKKWTKSD